MAKAKESAGRIAAGIVRQGANFSNQSERLNAIKWRLDGSHLANFGTIYYPKEFPTYPPDFHLRWFRDIYANNRNIKVWPRGTAKTSIIKLFLRYCAATHGRDDLVPREYQFTNNLFIAKIQDVADRILGQVYRQLTVKKPLIRDDFGDNLVWEKVSASELRLANGWNLIGVGADGTVRGAIGEEGERPEFIAIDDLIDKKMARSIKVMKQIFEWVDSEVMGLEGVKLARVNMLANRMHRVDVVGRILGDEKLKKAWKVEQLSMVLERDGEGRISQVLWPNVFTVEWCRAKEAGTTRKSWRTEYQNEPFDDDDLIFKRDQIAKFRFDSAEVDATWPAKLAIDVASGDTDSKDPDRSVIGLARRGPDKIVRVQKIAYGTFGQIEIIRIVFSWIAADPRIREAHYENIGVGMSLGPRIIEKARKDGVRIRVIKVDNKSRTKMGIPLNKIERVGTLELPINEGDIRFAAAIPEEAISEIADFPTAEYRDIPDMVQMLDAAFTGKAKQDGEQKPQFSGAGMVGADPNRINN